MNVCIIPARIGSKRIEKKNIIMFEYKPIISYSIETAIDSKLFDLVIVSTDSEEVADIACKYGADVYKSKIHSDYSTMNQVVQDTIKNYLFRDKVNDICVMYACAPLVRPKDLKNSYDKFKKDSNDMLITVVKSTPYQKLLADYSGNIMPIFSDYSSRSQDIGDVYKETGSFYWITAEGLENVQTKFFDSIWPNSGYYVMAENRCQDVDNPEDIEILKIKFRMVK